MSTNIKVVIGSNFGDEGKGLMVDYFCHELLKTSDKVLNIRFNGGSQAGHTVQTDEGIRHIFSHFGAGSLNENVHTYLSRDFIVNPITFRTEFNRLQSIGITPVVFVHENARITEPQDMLINQFVEARRGGAKHGSCGVGIFETITRYSSNESGSVYISNRMRQLGITSLTLEEYDLLNNQGIRDRYLEDFQFLIDHTTPISDEREFLSQYSAMVFEGAQGLLLDMNNLEYFPNLTPSNTGVRNTVNIIPLIKNPEIEVCYVTRTYFTRHGAGKLATEADFSNLDYDFIDETNVGNPHQGNLRYGFFDLELFKKTILNDIKFLENINFGLSFAITHCNVTNNKILMLDKELPVESLTRELGLDVDTLNLYLSSSKTRTGVKRT